MNAEDAADLAVGTIARARQVSNGHGDVWDAVNVVDGKIPRDRYGRPMVPPVKGGKPRPLTRVTTLAETLDDRYNLEKWKVRQAAIGLMLRPDLLALVAAQQNDKQLLDRTCDDAIDAAKGGAAGNTGTALHGLLQRHLNQEPLDHIPAELRADIDAAMDCLTRHGFKVLHVEQFVVCEQLEAAGTPDLILTQGDRVVIGDWKTGAGAIDYGLPSISIQEAIYTRAETMWSPTTGHVPMPLVDQTRAYVFHLPAGSGHCECVEVDVAAGWEAAKTARWVRAWRQRKDLGRSVTDAADNLTFERELIATRVRALPQGAVDFLARKVADHGGLPRVSQSAAAHLDVWADLLVEVEAEFEMPFEPKKRAKK